MSGDEDIFASLGAAPEPPAPVPDDGRGAAVVLASTPCGACGCPYSGHLLSDGGAFATCACGCRCYAPPEGCRRQADLVG